MCHVENCFLPKQALYSTTGHPGSRTAADQLVPGLTAVKRKKKKKTNKQKNERERERKKRNKKKRLMTVKWQVVWSPRSQSTLGCKPATFVQVQRQNHLVMPPTFLGLVQGQTNCFTLWIQTVNNTYFS